MVNLRNVTVSKRGSFRIPLVIAVAAVAVGSWSSSRSHAARAAAALPTRHGSPPIDGIYAICAGARSHIETMTLREGTFQHFIQAHGIYGNRRSGTYTQVGDTLVLDIQKEGPLPEGVERPTPLGHDFVVGEYAGLPVLWRGKAVAQRVAADPRDMSEYHALFYGGTDPLRWQVPSCGAILRWRGVEMQTESPDRP